MTVIVQDDHLTAGAWAACGLTRYLTCELSSWTLEEKFYIYARPCIILYMSVIKLEVKDQLNQENRFNTYLLLRIYYL